MQKMNKILLVLILIVASVGMFVVGIESLDQPFSEDSPKRLDDRSSAEASVDLTIDSFDGNLDSVVLTQGKYYSFVLDEKLEFILAHPREELIGTSPTGGLHSADISINEMLNRLDQYGSTWIYYEFYNPETGNVDPKTTYLVKHEGYVFGAGFYSP